MNPRDESSPAAPQAASSKPTHVVGIGASAGGLEPLETFFDNLEPDTGMAFIVVQHLSPDFKSLMNELLSRHTQMKIQRVEEGMTLEANSVYLIPPRKIMTIEEGQFRLAEVGKAPAENMIIDPFFRSLGKQYGQQAVAIILSGSGSDGSRSMEEIAARGVLTIAQKPETAAFDSMPRSAIQTECVDLVLDPSAMPIALADHARSDLKGKVKNSEPLDYDTTSTTRYAPCFKVLYDTYGIDFSHYKATTVERRIERRMTMLGINQFEKYCEMLQHREEELNLLYQDLLIGVTRFYRDPEAFKVLEEKVFPLLLHKEDGEDLRLWVCGCATGEEAYSLAISLRETAAKLGVERRFKIFATDTHSHSLSKASAGIYPAQSLEYLDQTLIAKYFRAEGDRYRVSKWLREQIVFSEQNVLRDPPFTKIDLVSCRNMLIYFKIAAQKRALSMLHFALRKGGVLFLGSSENLGSLSDEFETIDHQGKIYRKLREINLTSRHGHPLTGGLTSNRMQNRYAKDAAEGGQRLGRVYDAVLDKHMPPSLLLNRKGEVLHVFGDAGEYVKVLKGRVSHDLRDMVEGDLRIALTTGLQKLSKSRERVEYRGVQLQRNGDGVRLDLVLEYLGQTEALRDYIFVHLKEVEAERFPTLPKETASSNGESTAKPADGIAQERIDFLEQELKYTRENLQSTVEQLETSNEELQATNEEMIASNEELQSTNEELHSVNEELYTVNAEYERKNRELEQLASDMDNLLESTRIGTIFVDRNLSIRKFTPTIEDNFKLLPQDIGRPIDHIATDIQDEIDWKTNIRKVIESGNSSEREVTNRAGKHFLKRILPYYNSSDAIDGAVITFIDIDRVKTVEQQLRELNRTLEQRVEERTKQIQESELINRLIVDISGVAVWEMDAQSRDLKWKDNLAHGFGYQSEDIGTQTKWLKQIESSAQERILGHLNACLAGDEDTFQDEVSFQHADHTAMQILLWGTAVRDDAGNITRMVGAMLDVTILKNTQIELENQKQWLVDMIESASDSVLVLDKEYRVVLFNDATNQAFQHWQGHSLNTGDNVLDLMWNDEDRQKVRDLWGAALRGEEAYRIDEFASREGEVAYYSIVVNPVKNVNGEIVAAVGFSRNITQQMEDEKRLRSVETEKIKLQHSNEALEQFAYLASHDLQEPLRMVTSFVGLLADKFEGGLDSEGQEYMQYILGGAQRMKLLIDNLLQYSRLSSGKQRLSQVSMRQAIDDAQANLHVSLQETEAKVEVAEEVFKVEADFQHMVQLWQNLIGNALKFRRDEAPHVRIQAEEKGSNIHYSIHDNGIGIPENQLGKIFTVFHRLHTQQKYPGTGIGLTMCEKIVQRHHGRIWVESKEGQGTSFHFLLPKKQPPAAGE